MKKSVFLLMVLELLVLTCSKKNITNNYYYGSEEGASIVGVVYPPESGATVTAYLGIPVASIQIDAVGYFKFSNLPVGSYSLVVQAEGYYEETRKASVKEQSTVVLDTIRLAPIGQLVSSVSPQDGALEVRLTEPIRIWFRNPMNQTSVEAAFRIEPTAEGEFFWYLKDPSVIFEAVYNLAANTRYQVKIDTTACDTAGITLLRPYEFAFSTEDIRVERTDPSNGQTGVSPSVGVTVFFNTDMDAGSVMSAFRMVDSGPRVVSGEFVWPSQQLMQFRPSSALAANETYTVTIDTTACDIHGGRLSPRYQFSFQTESLKIDYTSPQDNDTQVYPLSSVGIVFNTDMDVESANAAFTMVNSKENEVTGSFSWSGLRQMKFQPDSALQVSETYTVTIDTTASALKGTKLAGPYQFCFSTAPITISSHPGDNYTGVRPYTDISIAFNTYMNEESVNSAFRMVDSKQNEVMGGISWSAKRQMEFDPHSDLALNEEYTITIDTTASDLHGARLVEPHRFSFTTEPLTVSSTPGDGETWVSPRTGIRMGFNTEMDMESTNSAFSMIDSELNEVTGNFAWLSQWSLEFNPHVALAANEKYTVMIDTSACSIQGVRLSEPYEFWFITQPIIVGGTSPKDRETWVSPTTRISIGFNTDMDIESVISAFKMVDSGQNDVSGEFLSSYASIIEFHPSSSLAPSEVYTVTIAGSAADLHGSTLGTAYSFWFKTSPE